MKYKVVKKHNNSDMCVVCGLVNPFSVKVRFYESETGEIIGIFKGAEHHQGFPGRMHGGIISTVLDEVLGRSLNVKHPEEWSVTVELNVRFKKPIPLDTELKAVSRLEKENRKLFEATGEIYLPDGTIAATAWGKFFRGTPVELKGMECELTGWRRVNDPLDPVEIEI